MKFPCELLTEPYLAQIRIEISQILKHNGLTQTEIANLLQVSQPVVSGYLKKSKNQANLPQIILSRAKEVSVQIADILNNKGINGTEEAIRIGCTECKIMRQSGPTCIYHQQVTSNLDKDCTSCLTQTHMVELQLDKQGVIRELSNLFDKLSNKNGFDKMIPEIGMQIIHSVNNPESMNDIAAFPGRIIKRKGSHPLADTPTFGSSETTSQILLDLRSLDHQVRSIVALKTSDWLENRIHQRKINHVVIERFEEIPNERITEVGNIDLPFIIIGKNSRGFESISYLCTDDIEELGKCLFQILSV